MNWFFRAGKLGPAHERDIVVRAANRPRLSFTGLGITEELLSPNLTGPLEMLISTIAPGADSDNYSHDGAEAGLVLERNARPVDRRRPPSPRDRRQLRVRQHPAAPVRQPRPTRPREFLGHHPTPLLTPAALSCQGVDRRRVRSASVSVVPACGNVSCGHYQRATRVSTAQLVPETRELSGDEARAVMREARFWPLLFDSIRRLRAADGFTHARSLALVTVLTVIPGVVVVVGAAHALGANSFRAAVADVFNAISPGQSGEVVTAAIGQGANENLGLGGALIGALAMLISGVTLFGQIERSANRIYGVETDRPFLHKYGRAIGLFVLTLTIAFAAFLILGTMRHLDFPGPDLLWFGIRSVILVGASALGTAVVFRLSPRRRQPDESWLIVGAVISVAICAAATLVLAGMWRVGNAFGHTYGALAGVVAFVIWTYLICLGLHVGLAFAAQLEALRAGRSQPQDAEKVEESEPESCRDDSPDANSVQRDGSRQSLTAAGRSSQGFGRVQTMSPSRATTRPSWITIRRGG